MMTESEAEEIDWGSQQRPCADRTRLSRSSIEQVVTMMDMIIEKHLSQMFAPMQIETIEISFWRGMLRDARDQL